MENSNSEIRANIKFLTKLEWKPKKIIESLRQIYGDSSPSKSVVYDWINRFKNGREDLKDNPREGRPSTAKYERTVTLVQSRWKKIVGLLLMQLLMKLVSLMAQHFQF